MAIKLKIMENEKYPLDNLKNDEITEKREKGEMYTVGPGPIATHPLSPTHPLPFYGPGVPLYWGI